MKYAFFWFVRADDWGDDLWEKQETTEAENLLSGMHAIFEQVAQMQGDAPARVLIISTAPAAGQTEENLRCYDLPYGEREAKAALKRLGAKGALANV